MWRTATKQLQVRAGLQPHHRPTCCPPHYCSAHCVMGLNQTCNTTAATAALVACLTGKAGTHTLLSTSVYVATRGHASTRTQHTAAPTNPTGLAAATTCASTAASGLGPGRTFCAQAPLQITEHNVNTVQHLAERVHRHLSHPSRAAV